MKLFVSMRNSNNLERFQSLKLGTGVCEQTPTSRSSVSLLAADFSHGGNGYINDLYLFHQL